jgi:type IV pilus assembly protein PilM
MLFASKTGMGLDVDDLSLELVVAQSSAKEVKRVAVSRVVLPVGVISNGVIKDEQKLAQAIRRLLAEAQPKAVKPGAVVFGVPHSQFYPALVELPLAETKALKELVWKLAQENLPVATEDLLLDYKVLSQKEEVAQVLMVGVSRAYLMSWQKFLASLGIKVEAFDIAAYALCRDLKLADRQRTVAVVDIGARKTNVFVFDRGQLNYSYDFEIGGHHLTKVLAEKLEIGREEAENKKVKQGLVAQLLPAWQEALYELAREVVVALTDYQSKTGLLVKEIKLVGGGAKLKGLVNYLEEKIPLLL